MCYGPFAGVDGRDHICVQSLDGVLSFFEQDSVAFKRMLPPETFVIPGPLIYVPACDTFVTCDSAMVIHAYRYSVLAAATDGSKSEGAVSLVPTESRAFLKQAAETSQHPWSFQFRTTFPQPKGKQVQVDWSVNLGQHATHIFSAKMLRSQQYRDDLNGSGGGMNQMAQSSGVAGAGNDDLIVVGERHLFYIKAQTGEVKLQKRIEYDVCCACTYPVYESSMGMVGDGVFHNLIRTFNACACAPTSNRERRSIPNQSSPAAQPQSAPTPATCW